jgi:hypothetical protein
MHLLMFREELNSELIFYYYYEKSVPPFLVMPLNSRLRSQRRQRHLPTSLNTACFTMDVSQWDENVEIA